MSGEPSDSERLTRLEDHVSALQGGQGRIEVALQELTQKFSQREKTNWPVILSILGLFLSLFTIFAGIAIPSVGAFLLFTDLRSTNQLAQLRFQEIAPLAAAAELSKRDRQELHSNSERNTEAIFDLRNADGRTVESLREVETQIKLIHDTANQRDSSYWQMIALLWRQAYGSDLPHYPYAVHPKEMP